MKICKQCGKECDYTAFGYLCLCKGGKKTEIIEMPPAQSGRMNHDDIIRMVREVADPDTTDPLCGGDQRDLVTLNLDEMVRFAALVAAAEREACALVCDEEQRYWKRNEGRRNGAESCAKAIRARGEK